MAEAAVGGAFEASGEEVPVALLDEWVGALSFDAVYSSVEAWPIPVFKGDEGFGILDDFPMCLAGVVGAFEKGGKRMLSEGLEVPQ